MNQFNIYVCEKFFPEFTQMIKKEGLEDVCVIPYPSIHTNRRIWDVCVIPYPSICMNPNKKSNVAKIISQHIDDGNESVLLCSKQCDVLQLIPPDSPIRVCPMESCSELVCFNVDMDEDAKNNLKELSESLGLGYRIVPFTSESMQLQVKNIIYEWKLKKNSREGVKTIAAVQSQSAEYAAILDLIGKITSYTDKHETIEKIKEIFIMVFGAQQFKYWNYSDDEKDSLPDIIRDLFEDNNKSFVCSEDKEGFCIKIEQNDKLYGAIDVSHFMFPNYIEKYLNFANEIGKVCGLVLSNIEQYDTLIKSEKELQYLSYHDFLTGLYNRTYLNKILKTNKDTKYLAVFMFDIDKLKYVNDNFGHTEGDKLICSVSDILKKCFRETDTVARIGGDEFLSILPECDIEMAETIKNRINESIILHNDMIQVEHLKLSLSIGFALSANHTDTLENIIKKADELMYVDKIGKRKQTK